MVDPFPNCPKLFFPQQNTCKKVSGSLETNLLKMCKYYQIISEYNLTPNWTHSFQIYTRWFYGHFRDGQLAQNQFDSRKSSLITIRSISKSSLRYLYLSKMKVMYYAKFLVTSQKLVFCFRSLWEWVQLDEIEYGGRLFMYLSVNTKNWTMMTSTDYTHHFFRKVRKHCRSNRGRQRCEIFTPIIHCSGVGIGAH